MAISEAGRTPERNNQELLHLIQRCVAGEESAWAEFYRQYNPKLRSWTLRFTALRGEVDDVLQDSWCHLMANHAKALASYTPRAGASFESWLYVVQHHFCLWWVSREARHRNVLHDDRIGPCVTPPQGPCVDPALLMKVLAAIADLPPRERQILSLRIEGYSLSEIGDRLGETAGNIGVILFRIREGLREQWGGAV